MLRGENREGSGLVWSEHRSPEAVYILGIVLTLEFRCLDLKLSSFLCLTGKPASAFDTEIVIHVWWRWNLVLGDFFPKLHLPQESYLEQLG